MHKNNIILINNFLFKYLKPNNLYIYHKFEKSRECMMGK
ncbi:hypothetical protein LCGC14_2426010, partial [marine sediment metagenome]